jgi:hypothetical protein
VPHVVKFYFTGSHRPLLNPGGRGEFAKPAVGGKNASRVSPWRTTLAKRSGSLGAKEGLP